MENQKDQFEDQNQQQQQSQGEDNTVTQGGDSGNAGNLVPDEQISGSDADTDPSLDTSISPDTEDDENDASGIGSQTEDVEADESAL